MTGNEERLEVSQEWWDTLKLLFLTSERAPFDFAGIPVFVNKYMPADTAIQLDRDGKIVGIFKLGAA